MAESDNAVDTGGQPYRNYNFQVEIPGVAKGHFTRVDGPCIRVASIPYREGGEKQIVRQLVGPPDYGPVTLHYGLMKLDSQELWNWLEGATKAKVVRKQISIVLLGAANDAPVLRWNLFEAWPTSWCGAPLDAMGREVAVESLTIAYESLARE